MSTLVPVADLSLHPQAGLVPQMREEEFAEFVADVRERGIKVAIEVEPGTRTILDGRCRWLAAREAELEKVPVIEAPLHGEDPVIYMLRAASKRRQLSDDQRAMLAVREKEYLAERGKRERAKKGRAKGGKATSEQQQQRQQERLPDDVTGKRSHDRSKESRTKAARSHNVSERKVRQAEQVKKHSPELAEQVLSGEKRLPEAVREVQREQKRAEQQTKAEAAEARMPEKEERWRIIEGDCRAHLGIVERPRLIFADPPYNIGVDYGEGTKADRLKDDDYLEFCSEWIAMCWARLTEDGSFWVLINDEYAAWIGCLLYQHDFHQRAWIKWYETFGVNCENNFNRCSRHLFYCVKNPKRFVFHPEAVNRPSDRQTKYGDARANPSGKIWDDVWQIPRLVGTAKERLPDFPTQLPLELLTPIIACSSDPGDLVLDPFCGSATTGLAALRQSRLFVGIEKSSKYAELGRERIKANLYA